MVLSNKKLKQKLRAAKAELLAASEAQNQSINKNFQNPETPDLETQQSLNPLSGLQKPRLSKREKRRQKAPSLQENDPKLNKHEDARSEGVVEDKKKKNKRKRDESQELENGELKKVKKLSKKKKKKKKKKNKERKGKEKEENGEVQESLESGAGGIDDQGLTQSVNYDNSKGSLDACTKVYVGGIPYYSSEDDIRSYFEGCGTITEIDCMKFPESGKFRGIAVISFKTEAAARRALALDGSDMGGLFLKIQPYKSARVSKTSNFSPKFVEGYNRIYVGNLSWDIAEDDLKEFFSGCNITSIHFGEDKETGEFRGYAHVDFSDSLSLKTALKLDQKIVCGRPIRISCAVPKKGSENKTKPLPDNNQAVDDGAAAVSGKIRRRTCYECGERGHLSSSCPKKQAVDQTSPQTS